MPSLIKPEERKENLLNRLKVTLEQSGSSNIYIEPFIFQEMLELGLSNEVKMNTSVYCFLEGEPPNTRRSCYFSHTIIYEGIKFETLTNQRFTLK